MVAALTVVGAAAQAQITGTMQAMSTFGGGDGWIGPNDAPATGTGNGTRGMAYNPVTGNVIVVTRNTSNIQVINGQTGAIVGTLNTTGISGGTFAYSTAAVADDGRIYVANLTTNDVTSPYKIYRYDNEAAAPVLVYSGTPIGVIAPRTAGSRFGDSLDVIGSGTNTRLVAGTGTNASPGSESNGFVTFDYSGASLTSTAYTFTGTPPNNGDFRLGVTFGANRDTIYGTQGASVGRRTTITGGVGVYDGGMTLSSASERGMDFAVIDGVPVLATVDTVSNLVRIYNFTNAAAPSLLASLDIATDVANSNGTNSVKFGAISGKNADLYVMNTNNGVMAFRVNVVPEPATMTALALGAAALLRRRRKA